MRSRSTTKFLALLCALLLAGTVGGVFAIWRYAEDQPLPESEDIGITLSEFVWTPEEILPTETPGENYMDLLDSILNNVKGGLNSDKDTLEKALLQDMLVHSSQNVQGGNLKHLFITEASRELDFIIQYISDDEFLLFIFENDDITAGQINVTKIKSYMTILVFENGEWIGRESQLGYATLRYIKDNDYIAIDPSEWVKGDLPK